MSVFRGRRQRIYPLIGSCNDGCSTLIVVDSELIHKFETYECDEKIKFFGERDNPPALSLQYFRATGSIGTPSNSSIMHWTSSDVVCGFFPPDINDVSDRAINVSGTRTRDGE